MLGFGGIMWKFCGDFGFCRLSAWSGMTLARWLTDCADVASEQPAEARTAADIAALIDLIVRVSASCDRVGRWTSLNWNSIRSSFTKRGHGVSIVDALATTRRATT